MRLSDSTYEEIKCAVADMFVFYDIKGIPINSFEVAVKIGLTVIPYSALSSNKRNEALEYNEDGYSVETLSNEWIIYYNDFDKDYTRIVHVSPGSKRHGETAYVRVCTNDCGKFKVVADISKYKTDGKEKAVIYPARRKK